MSYMEAIVRPFVSRDSARTKRIITSVAGDDPTPAIITWGQAGAVPQGAPANNGEDLSGVGFRVNCCQDDWAQKAADYEEVKHYATDAATGELDLEHYIVERRPTKLSFDKENNSCLNANGGAPFSWVAFKVDASFAEWDAKIGDKSCGSSYKLNY